MKVTFKFVLAAVMIVNVGIGLFVRMCSETALQSLAKCYAMKFIILGEVQKNLFNVFPLWHTHK